MTAKYTVFIQERIVYKVEVDCDTPEEAKNFAREHIGEDEHCEQVWTAHEVNSVDLDGEEIE